MKFTIHEKQVKAKFGADYDLSRYTEGVDYKRQKTGFGSRVMFKTGLFDLKSDHNDLSGAQVSLSDVILDQEPDHVGIFPDIVVYEQQVGELSVNIPEHVGESADMVEPIVARPALLDGAVRTAKVVKKHQNQRYVETDTLGTVFVGGKAQQVKLNQVISVKDGCLYLG
jgi:hypothetical protein